MGTRIPKRIVQLVCNVSFDSGIPTKFRPASCSSHGSSAVGHVDKGRRVGDFTILQRYYCVVFNMYSTNTIQWETIQKEKRLK